MNQEHKYTLRQINTELVKLDTYSRWELDAMAPGKRYTSGNW